MNKAIVLLPRLSEKTYALSEKGLYVFTVDPSLNKHEIAEAVEATYNVTVETVRTITAKGKTKRLYRNRKYETGTRATTKKAYVQLKDGEQIPVFASVTDEVKVDNDPKVDKKSKKEKKEK